jgi:hypothetical protein
MAHALLIMIFMASGGVSFGAQLTERFLLHHKFIACDDTSDVSCVSSPSELVFRPHRSMASDLPALQSDWQILSTNRLRIGKFTFRMLASPAGILFAPAYEAAPFGFVIAQDTPASRRALRRRESTLQTSSIQRAIANFLLSSASDPHDACIKLITVGDESSIVALIRVLPTRPKEPQPNTGFVCTVGHCNEALRHITGKNCGPYREDWQECLASPVAPAREVSAMHPVGQ